MAHAYQHQLTSDNRRARGTGCLPPPQPLQHNGQAKRAGPLLFALDGRLEGVGACHDQYNPPRPHTGVFESDGTLGAQQSPYAASDLYGESWQQSPAPTLAPIQPLQWLSLSALPMKQFDIPTVHAKDLLSWSTDVGPRPYVPFDQQVTAPAEMTLTPSVVSSLGGSTYSTPTCRTMGPNETVDASGYQYEALTSASSWSRGPSPRPFGHGTSGSSGPAEQFRAPPFSCAGPACDTTFESADALARHLSLAHAFQCSWAACQSPGFASRDGLNWHVKAEHLVICPVPGCPEASFTSHLMLQSHIRVAHQTMDPETGAELDVRRPGGPQTVQAKLPQSVELVSLDRHQRAHIKEEVRGGPASTPKETSTSREAYARALELVAVAAKSKKRCREQLCRVVEKRARRAGNKKDKDRSDVDSPPGLVRSRTPELVETAPFPLIWEHGVLPFLVELMPNWSGQGFAINVLRGKSAENRCIAIMTRRPLSRARRIIIAAQVKDLLPSAYSRAVSFTFSAGSIDRLASARGLGPNTLDDLCNPRNPYFYRSPVMGDSIGIDVADPADESTSTLGPCLTVGGGSYWLANFHPFVDQWQKHQSIEITHPSPKDRERCIEQQHDALDSGAVSFKLGDLIATSGVDLKTTRVSHEPYWEDMDLDPQLIVTDWTLISASTSQANLLRRFPDASARKEVPVTRTASIDPGARVLSTGRTSGFQRGQICEVPAYVDGSETGVGRATREWFVEEPEPYDNENGWIRGGIGVEGDSGAAVVDAATNALLGQVWGRNRYWGDGSRITYFTPIADILDDIQERCGQQGRPQLPQYRDEADCWPCYPVCQSCFDMRFDFSSRRGSSTSLQSVAVQMASQSSDGSGSRCTREEQDSLELPNESSYLTSPEGISDLAQTPKDPMHFTQVGLQHSGQEDGCASSITSAPSTAALLPGLFNTPFSFRSAGTVGVASPGGLFPDLRSPYAMKLSDEDLYDAEYDEPDALSGKRAALSLTRSSAKQRLRQNMTSRDSHTSKTQIGRDS